MVQRDRQNSPTSFLFLPKAMANPCGRAVYDVGLWPNVFLGMPIRISPGAWKYVSCECCVLSGRGLYDGPITRPEEFYWLWWVWVWSWRVDNKKALAHQRLLLHGKIRGRCLKRRQFCTC